MRVLLDFAGRSAKLSGGPYLCSWSMGGAASGGILLNLSKRRRLGLWIAGFLLVAPGIIFLLHAFAPHLLTLGPPHRVYEVRGKLTEDLAGRILSHPDANTIHGLDDLIRFSLQRTSELLHPGLDHPFSLVFANPREGHCLEYSHLFGTIFNLLAIKKGIDHRALVVRSSDPRFVGRAIPLAGFESHDFVMIKAGQSGPRGRSPGAAGSEFALYLEDSNLANHALFIDAMFYDVFYIYDIRHSIRR